MATIVNLYAANVDLGIRPVPAEEMRYFVYVMLFQQFKDAAGQIACVRKLTRAFFVHELPISIIPRRIWDSMPAERKVQFQFQKTPPWWPYGNVASPNFVPSPYEFGRFDLELISNAKKRAYHPLTVDTAFSCAAPAAPNHKHIILGWNFLYRINAHLGISIPPPLQVHLSTKSSQRCGTLRIE